MSNLAISNARSLAKTLDIHGDPAETPARCEAPGIFEEVV